jgi:hypothetical protein
VGSRGMNSSLSFVLKLLGLAVLVLIIAHFWPALAGIAFVGVATVLAAAGALAAGVGGLLTVGLGVVFAIGAVVVVLGVVLAPIWLPILAIVGLVMLVRSLARSPAPASR